MEMTQLNRTLVEAMGARSKQEQLARRLKAVEADLARMRAEATQLQTDLAREEQDVLRLKEGGLIGLWYDLVGKRERQLAKEEEEAALARIQYAQAAERLQALEGERSELVANVGALGEPAGQVEDLLDEKRHLIRLQFPGAADKLLSLDEEEHRLQSQLHELAEAKAAGSRASVALERMGESLESAHRLGVWDAWTKGGILVDLAKHDRLDEAEQWAEEVQKALNVFQRELRDVDAAIQAPSIGIGSWERGFDIWFDNLWTDWSILNQIEGAFEQVQETGNHLLGLLDRLKLQMAKATADLNRVRDERESFLTNFGQQ